jgi:hypothetical protein
VADLDPHPAAEAALGRSSARLRGNSLRIAKLLEHARPYLTTSSSNLLRAVEETLTISMRLADEWDPEVRPAEARPLPEPTIARVARVRTVAHRLPLRAAAMLQRLVSADQAPGGHSHAGQLTLVQQELNHFVAQGCSDFANALGARWIPVPDQAEHQASMVLASFDSLVGCSQVGIFMLARRDHGGMTNQRRQRDPNTPGQCGGAGRCPLGVR